MHVCMCVCACLPYKSSYEILGVVDNFKDFHCSVRRASGQPTTIVVQLSIMLWGGEGGGERGRRERERERKGVSVSHVYAHTKPKPRS